MDDAQKKDAKRMIAVNKLLSVQSNKVRALDKVMKAFADSDLNENIVIQDQLKNQSGKATNDAVKELKRS